MNPFGWTGPEFLIAYLVGAGAVAVWMISIRARATRRPTARVLATELDAAELAYLAGGWPRAVEAAVAGLHHRGLVEAAGGTLRATTGAPSQVAPYRGLAVEPALSTVERHVQVNLPTDVGSLVRAGSAAELELHASLAARGLVVPDARAATRLARLPAYLLAAVGGLQIVMKIGTHPVLLLVGLVGATLLAPRWFSVPRTTTAGDELVARARRQHVALELTAATAWMQVTAPQMALAYALFGSAVAAPALIPVMPSLQTPPPPTTSASCGASSSCGSSDSSSGCGSSCGSGCGGCGGCS